MSFIKKLVNIKPGEGKMVLTFFLFSFSMTAMMLIAKTAKDAYFLSRFEKSLLPLMFVGVAIIIAPILIYYSKLSKRLPPRVLLMITCSIFFISFVIAQPIMTGWVIPTVYIWIEIVGALMVIQFWGFASESFEPQQAKRLFGIIGGGGSFAITLIGMNLKPFVNAFGTDELLYVSAGFLIFATLFGLMAIKYFRKTQIKKSITTSKPKKIKKKDPFIFGIGTIVVLSAIVTILVDYQFKIIASSSFPDESDLVGFFGTFYSIAGAASIAMQFFITGNVLSRYGILIGLLILPLFLVAGSISILLVPMLMSASFAKFSDQTFKFTINNSSLELLWLPVHPTTRKTLKPQVSGTLKSIGEGFGGIVTFLLVKIISIQYLSVVSLFAILGWLFTSFRVKSGYVKQLESAISKRQIDFEELNVDVQDAAMVKTIEETLSSDDEIKQLFAFEIIEGLPLHSWEKTIKKLFNEGSIDVRKRILSIAWDEELILTNDDIIAAMKKNDEVKSEAIIVAGRRKLEQVLPDIEAFLESGDQEIRAASAIAIVELGSGATQQAESILIEMLNSDNELTQSKALERLVDNDNILTQEKLIEFLTNEGTVISNVAIRIAEKRNDEELIPAIISNLDIPKTSLQARQALGKFSDEIILNQFESLLSSEETLRKLRLGIIRALRDFPNDESINHLISQLSSTDQDIYNESVDSLLAIARIEPLNEENIKKISEEINLVANKLYALYETIKILPENEDSILILDYLNNEIQSILPTLLKLGVMGIPDTPIETYIQTVKSRDPAKLPFLLEFFENIFTKDQRQIINPLIEPISIDERSKIGHNNFKKLPNNLDNELITSTYDPDKWKSVISLDYLLKTEKTDVIKSLDWQKVQPSNANQELLLRQLQKNGMNLDFIPKERFKLEGLELAMYSTLEKTIILKSVDMFKSIPAENLSRVAQITEEVEFESNTQIMAEGDYGDSLFIVVDGNVKIHKGDKEIVRLGKGACLGEMALLDGEPRSADATVTEDSTLFKIEQEGFYEVMGSQSEIMEGIIKLLSGKLRDTNEKLMSK